MNLIEMLEKEEKRLIRKLSDFKKKSDTRVLSKGLTCLERSNRALKKHIKTNEDKYLKWAKIWDDGRKHFVKIGQEQSKHNYFIDEIVKTESDLSEIRNELFYKRKNNG